MSKETARAKINLTLRVLGKRTDGYHMLQSLVVFAQLGDELTLDITRSPGCAVSGPFAAEIVGENLIDQTLDLLAARHPQLQLGFVQLDKRLPIAAGIGGGSADAGAVLRLIRRANSASSGAQAVDWSAIALELGADVPVCLASSPVLMSGIGDAIAPLRYFPEFHAVLVNPLAVMPRDKTRSIFELYDAPDLTQSARDTIDVSVLETKEKAATFILQNGNDLQKPCATIAPVVDEILAAVNTTNQCWLARMSGAGPTCFGLYEDAPSALMAAQNLSRQQPDWWVKVAQLGGA